MTQIDQVIELNRLIGELTSEVRNLRLAFDSLEKDVADLKQSAAKWKGAFGLVLIFGSFLGWLVNLLHSFWERQ